MATTPPMVLTEDEALELLAFLVTAARTQLDEASEYGSLRLLTAANRLADAVADRVSPATRALLSGPLRQIPNSPCAPRTPRDTPRRSTTSAAPGRHLVVHFGLDRRAVTGGRAPPSAPNPVLAAIRSRRMVRAMVDRPSSAPSLKSWKRPAGRPSGNRHLHRFVVVEDPLALRVLAWWRPECSSAPRRWW